MDVTKFLSDLYLELEQIDEEILTLQRCGDGTVCTQAESGNAAIWARELDTLLAEEWDRHPLQSHAGGPAWQ